MSPEGERGERPISSAAELCLTLIMILPEQKDREERVRDFCRLYDIAEKRPAKLEATSSDTLSQKLAPNRPTA